MAGNEDVAGWQASSSKSGGGWQRHKKETIQKNYFPLTCTRQIQDFQSNNCTRETKLLL